MQPVKITFFILLALIDCFFLFGTVNDAQALTIGKSELHPFVAVKETFTDNVFSTPTSTIIRRDKITYYTPGMSFVFPFSVHRLDLTYNAVLTRYDTYRSEKTDDHRVRGVLDLKFGSRFNLVLTDAFNKEHEPRSSSTTGFIEIYKNNTAIGSVIYQLVDRSKVQIDYAKTSWAFRNSTFRDRREGLISGYLYYRFLPKTSAFIEYDVKNVDFSEVTTPFDNTMTSTLLGMVWEISMMSKGTIKAGRTSKDFRDTAVKDDEAWTASIDIRHDFTKYTSIALTGQRSISESSRLGSRFSLTTGFYLEAVHRFGYHLSTVFHGSTGTDKFPDIVAPETVARLDKNSSWGGGVKYLVREWLELSADYTRRARNSNINASDYHESQYSLMLSVTM